MSVHQRVLFPKTIEWLWTEFDGLRDSFFGGAKFSLAIIDLVNVNAFFFQEAGTELSLFLLLLLCRKFVYCVRHVLLRTNIFINSPLMKIDSD
jgi:hypothetical protein